MPSMFLQIVSYPVYESKCFMMLNLMLICQ